MAEEQETGGDLEREIALRSLESEVGEAHAVAARYDRASEKIVIDLRGGMTLRVPAGLLQGVAGASPELIDRVRVMAAGVALRWDELDADFSIQSLVAGSFGSRRWMQSLADEGQLDAASLERLKKVDELRVLRGEIITFTPVPLSASQIQQPPRKSRVPRLKDAQKVRARRKVKAT